MNKKPNILLIHADQHRMDALGCYGNKQVKTPNIDSIANDGTTFTNSFCSYPVCTPSRYSLLSGLHVHQHLGWSNHCTLPSGLPTLPKELKENGYKTKAIGKMHFTPTYLDVGFDELILSEQHGVGRYDDDYHKYLVKHGLADSVDMMDQLEEYRELAPEKYWKTCGAVTSDIPYEHYATTWIGNHAMDTIENWDDENPSMLMLGFIKPHHPFDPPEKYSNMYNPEELDMLPGYSDTTKEYDKVQKPYFPNEPELSKSDQQLILSKYYATISGIDEQVGRLIDKLKEKGLYDNTLIIYTSDHGDYMGYHHLILKGREMYDPLMKVPLIVKMPNEKQSNQSSDNLISNVDIMPTILSSINLDIPEECVGKSIMDEENDFIFATTGRQKYMIRDKQYKLILSKDILSKEIAKLYDISIDPYETMNLAVDVEYKNILEEYKQKLYNYMLFEASTPTNVDEYGPTINRKAELGYDLIQRQQSIDSLDKLFNPNI